jgi:hypothetical protein
LTRVGPHTTDGVTAVAVSGDRIGLMVR